MDDHQSDPRPQPLGSGRTRQTVEEQDIAVPISNLPNETLLEIFIHLRDMSPPVDIECMDEKEQLQDLLKQIEWTTVSHVCRHWREVALYAATLWTRPPLFSPAWATAMLERSRMADIPSIDIDWSLMKSEIIFTAIKHLPRVINFTSQQANDYNLEELSQKILGMEIPKLQSLQIHPRGQFYLDRAHDRQDFLLPDNLFTNAKKLRILGLWPTNISWSSPLLLSLSQLQLSNISYARRPTVAQLRSILDSMPGLERLRLVDALPVIDPTPEARTSGRRVPLRHLKELIVGGNSLELKTLALNIAPGPNLQIVHVNVIHKCELLRDLLDGSQMALTEQCSLSYITTVSVHYEGYECIGGIWSFKILDNTRPDLNIYFRGAILMNGLEGLVIEDEHGVELRFWKLFETVNWNHLGRLDLTSLDTPDTDRPFSTLLRKTFGTLENLKEIAVGDTMTWVLVEALDATEDTEDADDLFPGLEYVQFQSVFFYQNDGEDFFLDLLLASIEKRGEKGFPCCTIALTDCTGLPNAEPELLWSEEVIDSGSLPEDRLRCTCRLTVE